MNSYALEDPVKLNKVFLTLQGCMIEILKMKGDNNYKVPHLGNDELIRLGMLPYNLRVEKAVVTNALHLLMDAGMVEGVEDMADKLDLLLVPDLNEMM